MNKGFGRGHVGVLLGLLLAWTASDFAAAQPPVMAYELGTRASSGDGFDGQSLYARWPAKWLQRHWLNNDANAAWQARWDISVAQWDSTPKDIAFIAAGPVVEWRLADAPWRVSLGVQPTLISNHDDAGKDLGGPVQFTSHLSLAWAPAEALIIGLRAQHTSNARIYDENPGVDQVGVEIGIPF